jgi:hypothetical protein
MIQRNLESPRLCACGCNTYLIDTDKFINHHNIRKYQQRRLIRCWRCGKHTRSHGMTCCHACKVYLSDIADNIYKFGVPYTPGICQKCHKGFQLPNGGKKKYCPKCETDTNIIYCTRCDSLTNDFTASGKVCRPCLKKERKERSDKTKAELVESYKNNAKQCECGCQKWLVDRKHYLLGHHPRTPRPPRLKINCWRCDEEVEYCTLRCCRSCYYELIHMACNIYTFGVSYSPTKCEDCGELFGIGKHQKYCQRCEDKRTNEQVKCIIPNCTELVNKYRRNKIGNLVHDRPVTKCYKHKRVRHCKCGQLIDINCKKYCLDCEIRLSNETTRCNICGKVILKYRDKAYTHIRQRCDAHVHISKWKKQTKTHDYYINSVKRELGESAIFFARGPVDIIYYTLSEHGCRNYKCCDIKVSNSQQISIRISEDNLNLAKVIPEFLIILFAHGKRYHIPLQSLVPFLSRYTPQIRYRTRDWQIRLQPSSIERYLVP